MAKGLILEVTGLDELKKKIKYLPDNVVKELEAEFEAAADDFVERAINDAPRDEGMLIQGISKKKAGQLDYEVISAAKHSPFVEWGTKRRVKVPGDLQTYAAQFKGKRDGSGEGFFEAIFDWVKRKGIRYESAATYKSGKKKGQNRLLTPEQTAYIIYHFLLLTGNKPHPFFFKQRQPVMDALMQRVRPAIQKAMSK